VDDGSKGELLKLFTGRVDWLALYAEHVAAILAPGESPMLMIYASLPFGPAQETSRVGGCQMPRSPATARGGPGSHAMRILTQLWPSKLSHLLVTDRRVLFMDQVIGAGNGLALKAEVPRSAVVGVRRKTGLVKRGRVEITFDDESDLLILAGIVTGRRAKALIALLGPPPFPPRPRRLTWRPRYLILWLIAITVVLGLVVYAMIRGISTGAYCGYGAGTARPTTSDTEIHPTGRGQLWTTSSADAWQLRCSGSRNRPAG
jgi:hypothetical protein